MLKRLRNNLQLVGLIGLESNQNRRGEFYYNWKNMTDMKTTYFKKITFETIGFPFISPHHLWVIEKQKIEIEISETNMVL